MTYKYTIQLKYLKEPTDINTVPPTRFNYDIVSYIQVTVHLKNIDEIAEFVELFGFKLIDRVKINPLAYAFTDCVELRKERVIVNENSKLIEPYFYCYCYSDSPDF